MHNILKLGFSMSNERLEQDLEEKVRFENPSWNDKKVKKERIKIQKSMTLYNDNNKKIKKPKKEKK